MSVHYKFKSNLKYDTVTFDGLHISVSDLKKSIMQQKKIGKSSDFDLQITNAQTQEAYDNDENLIPKNTSVIIARVPVATGSKKNWEKTELPLPSVNLGDFSQIRIDKIVKNADLANSNVTEDDKVLAMINQSTQDYDTSQYIKSRSMTGPLPPSYTCYRCGKTGHWIKNCPTNNPDVRRSTGIPRSFMVPVDGPEHKGALLTSSGDYAVPRIDHQAYKEVKKEKPPFVAEADQNIKPDAEIPDELLCMFCKSLLQDAVLIPCCGNSFCDDCVRQALLDSDNHECPICHETDVSPDTVIPNRFLRTAVLNFKNETGYTRVKKMFQPIHPPPEPSRIHSPQPSPDSTVETQTTLCTETMDEDIHKDEDNEVIINPEPCNEEPKQKEEEVDVKSLEALEIGEDINQPGTPLADEPEESTLPVTSQGGHGEVYRSPAYSQGTPEHYNHDSQNGTFSEFDHATNQIQTITNIRRDNKFLNRPLGQRHHFPTQGPRHYDRHSDNRDHSDYRGRYDHRNYEKSSMRHDNNNNNNNRPSRFDHSQRDHRFHHSDNTGHQGYRDYGRNREHDYEHNRRRPRYTSPPPPATHAPASSYPIVPEEYSTLPTHTHHAPLLTHSTSEANFPSQPPPPGASPIDASPQPPPPGVGPLLPTTSMAESSSVVFSTQQLSSEENKPKTEESIDDRLEAFQRQLENRPVRERSSSRSSVSPSHKRSTTTSRSTRSRSYTSSHSWTRSPRSHSRSRSRARNPSASSYSSARSRSRSFSRSRSRSHYKTRSYSRSRSRTNSRSRSRDRQERKKNDSRSRPLPSYPRSHSTSHSPSPKHRYQHRYRHSPNSVRGNYNAPPPPFSTYPSSYSAAPSLNAFSAPYLLSQMHSVHSVQAMPVNSIEHCPPERRYQYMEHYAPPSSVSYDMYSQVPKLYQHHQRYERDTRTRLGPYDYQRRSEQTHHRIPGLVGDRSRQDYKARYRNPKEQSRTKEIRELPKVQEVDIPSPSFTRSQKSEYRNRESKEEVRKKEDKEQVRHKRHHHAKNDSQKEGKHVTTISSDIKKEKLNEPSNLISVEVLPEKDSEDKGERKLKNEDKPKEKKHKHKKRKSTDSSGKKKKALKKVKQEITTEGVPVKVKTKKKRKNKAVDPNKKKDKSKQIQPAVVGAEEEEEQECTSEAVVSTSVDIDKSKLDSLSEAEMVNAEEGHDIPVEKPSEIEPEDEEVLSEPEDVASTALYNEKEHGDNDGAKEIEEEAIVNEESAEENPQGEELELGVSDGELENEENQDELHVEVPELSKWEREEIDEDIVVKPQRRSAVVIPKEEKGLLSSDIIQRAEKAILQKRLRTPVSISPNERISQKSERVRSESPPPWSFKAKETSLSKPAAEKKGSPILEVTISADKEVRSVKAKEKKESSKLESSSRRLKLDRSKFNYPDKASKPQVYSRSVVVEPAEVEARKYNEEKEKRKSSVVSKEKSSSDHRSRDRLKSESRLPSEPVRDHRPKQRRHDSPERRRDPPMPPERIDRSRRDDKTRRDAREILRNQERMLGEKTKRSRSISRASSDSRTSSSKKQVCRRPEPKAPPERHSEIERKERHPEKSERRKAEVEKPKMEDKKDIFRQISHDESKFEPDYDEFSEPETVEKEPPSSKRGDSKTSKHVKQLEQVIRTVASLVKRKEQSKTGRHSETSSSTSDSDSSDSESKAVAATKSVIEAIHKHKKNKKHKKHKHKQKKKKSHKKSKL